MDSVVIVQGDLNFNDWIQLALVIFTAATVFVALFGDWAKHHLFKAKFTSRIIRPAMTKIQISDGRQHNVWYLNLAVDRPFPYPRVDDATVNLVAVAEKVNGRRIVKWQGQIPLQWQFPSLHPIQRPLNVEVVCDLCMLINNWEQHSEGHMIHHLSLLPLVIPNNLKTQWTSAADIEVDVRVVHKYGVSKTWRISLNWDGTWHDGMEEISQKLQVGIAETKP